MSDTEKPHKKGNPPVGKSRLYDYERIKQIPITDVCQEMLGIEVQKRYNKIWCKCRAETSASTLIHPDKNRFYDFGTNIGGDVIQFVSYVLGIDRAEAAKRLTEAYHVPLLHAREGLDAFELTDWEYKQIGLYGDMATKNFDFHADRMSLERLQEISDQYAIPMNELRRKHPKIYERLVRQKAIPFVRQLRNDYYLDVWGRYQLARAVGDSSLFEREETKKALSAEICNLQFAEKVLARAVKGTSIQLPPLREYDPVKDLECLSKGELKPTLGDASYREMQEAAKKQLTTVKYHTMDYDQYMNTDMSGHFHSAFLSAGRVVVGYLESDEPEFTPLFEAGEKVERRKGVLDHRIQKAKDRLNHDSREKIGQQVRER